jgi:regulator of sigma E protease
LGVVTFLIVLSVLVFFHELGHFLVARYFGVKVYRFSIGFGPVIFQKYFKGTQWALSLIPLGGYVKMKGQEDLEPTKISNDPDSYNVLTPLQKILILFAGPMANFILAFIFYILVALMPHNELAPVIGQVLKNTPAYYAKLKPNDTILKIDNKSIRYWDEIGNIVQNSQKALKIYIKRDNKILIKTLYPKQLKTKNLFGENIKKTMIGISPAPKIIKIQLNFTQSLKYAYEKTYLASKLIFQGIQKMITGVIGTEQIGGVISIGKIVSDASENGFVAVLIISALISVNLGVLNLLPIPALDGGHIMFNLYELITKTKPSDKVFANLTYAGWAILLFLMGLGIYNDINRFFAG